MIVTLQLGLLWLFVTLDMIESELFPKNEILQKNTTLRQYLFQIFFFYFVHVSKAKPMVDIRHDLSIIVFKLEAIENDDFRENVKYLISQKTTWHIWNLMTSADSVSKSSR